MFNIDSKNQITIIRKDTVLFFFSLDNYTLGNADTVIFTVAKGLERQNPAIKKEITEFEDGVATIYLSTVDTDIEEGNYYYDIEVRTKDGRVDTVINPCKFRVNGGVSY